MIDYYKFKKINDSIKRDCSKDKILHIEGNIGKNTDKCIVSDWHKKTKEVVIKNLVNRVIKGEGCISNPSALVDWGFERYMNSIVLWHGSNGGIIGDIDIKHSKQVCDFGIGFYLGDDKMQAENRVCNVSKAVLYKFELFIGDSKIYTFKDDTLWALYIAYNRGKFNFNAYPKLIKMFSSISKHDIVVGKIADDKIADAYNDFLEGNTTDKVLSESLKLVRYGKQYVIKHQRVCSQNKLKILNKVTLSKNEKQLALDWGKQVKKNMNSDLEKIKQSYRRQGEYIEEILERYK